MRELEPVALEYLHVDAGAVSRVVAELAALPAAVLLERPNRQTRCGRCSPSIGDACRRSRRLQRVALGAWVRWSAAALVRKRRPRMQAADPVRAVTAGADHPVGIVFAAGYRVSQRPTSASLIDTYTPHPLQEMTRTLEHSKLSCCKSIRYETPLNLNTIRTPPAVARRGVALSPRVINGIVAGCWVPKGLIGHSNTSFEHPRSPAQRLACLRPAHRAIPRAADD